MDLRLCTTVGPLHHPILGRIMVSIWACHARDRGSIPRQEELFVIFKLEAFIFYSFIHHIESFFFIRLYELRHFTASSFLSIIEIFTLSSLLFFYIIQSLFISFAKVQNHAIGHISNHLTPPNHNHQSIHFNLFSIPISKEFNFFTHAMGIVQYKTANSKSPYFTSLKGLISFPEPHSKIQHPKFYQTPQNSIETILFLFESNINFHASPRSN